MNINDYVWVELTPEGLDHLVADYAELASQLPEGARKVLKVPAHKAKTGEPVRFQMWDLMSIFGPAIGLGRPPMFVDNEIHFDDPALDGAA